MVYHTHFTIHHLDYQDVVIDQERLPQLPVNYTIVDTFNTVLHEEKYIDENNKDRKYGNNEATINEATTNEVTILFLVLRRRF